MAAFTLKGMGIRVGLPILGVWIVAILIGRTWAPIAAAVITLAAAALVTWALRFASKTRAVANIVKGADTPEARKDALAKLETDFKKGDTAAIFARAQLQLHEDPKVALATLEQINLDKVMAPIADEARAQRAMIHLTLGDVGPARQLVDNIDLTRQRDAKTRAMLTAICAEAWARTGNAKKATETLALLDPEDAEYEKLRPQLYRAMAYGYAHTNDIKGMRRVLKKLVQLDSRLLGGFMMKRTHPLLQKEAKRVAEQSGMVPRKLVVQRRV